MGAERIAFHALGNFDWCISVERQVADLARWRTEGDTVTPIRFSTAIRSEESAKRDKHLAAKGRHAEVVERRFARRSCRCFDTLWLG